MTRRTGPDRPTIAQSRTRTGDQADRPIPDRRVAPNPAAQAPPLWLINNAFHPDGNALHLADHPRRTDSDITIRTDNHIGKLGAGRYSDLLANSRADTSDPGPATPSPATASWCCGFCAPARRLRPLPQWA